MTQPLVRPVQQPGPAPDPAQPASPGPETRPAPPRHTAWTEGVRRLRAAAVTEPGRLRVIGAVLALLILVFGAATAWQFSDRTSAADSVVEHSQPLSADAARVYRSLADADTAASSGFLSGGDEPRSLRQRYEQDIKKASGLLASAAANSKGSPSAQREIAELNRGLPEYTGLVESARANNRQGLPLGGAYLRYANEQMRGELLPAAERSTRRSPTSSTTTTRTRPSGRGSRSRPEPPRSGRWCGRSDATTAVRTGCSTSGCWARRRPLLVTLLWLGGAHVLAQSALGESDEKGAQSLRVLNQAWIGSLQARGDENMTLVARGAGSEYEKSYRKQMGRGRGHRKGRPPRGRPLGPCPLARRRPRGQAAGPAGREGRGALA